MLKQVLRWTFAWLPAAALAATVSAQSAPPSTAPPGQVAPQIEKCLHGSNETAEERARRNEALAAMRMIDWARLRAVRVYPGEFGWRELSFSTVVRELQAMDGAVGDLARKITWGLPEPLPGWTMSWTTFRPILGQPLDDTRFVLTDSRDPCGFRIASTDPEVVNARERFRLQPLDAY